VLTEAKRIQGCPLFKRRNQHARKACFVAAATQSSSRLTAAELRAIARLHSAWTIAAPTDEKLLQPYSLTVHQANESICDRRILAYTAGGRPVTFVCVAWALSL
jgi:hypothetical protein